VKIRLPLVSGRQALSSSVDFRPFPLLGNAHVQTLLGHLLPGPQAGHPARSVVIWLPDGDGLMLHDNVPPGWCPGAPIAVLVHGLGGTHASPPVQRLAWRLLARRLRVVRLDQRGAGRGLPLARRCYHAGRSDDVRAALEEVHRWSPASPLLLMGISLGGAIVLKLAGEAGDNPVPGLARVAAIAPPIDLERSVVLLSQPRNRLYEQQFVREVTAEAYKRQRCFPDLPPLVFPRPLSMRLFDELYTAPRNGFAGALDYYRRASALPLLSRIRVPTLMLTARDDPFIAVEPFEEWTPPPAVEMHILPWGGHLGFVGWDGGGGVRWGERRAIDWLISGC
jgi:predicted alpha/beta-fold hydrolase